MTEEEIKYLQDLDALEGEGADKDDVKTSKYYGITNDGIAQISGTIRRKETNGEYTENAKKTRSILSKGLLEVLDDNIVWGKNADGENALLKSADVDQISKFGKEGMAELALAIRDINLRKIPERNGEPLRDDTINSVLLTAHNRPIVLVGKEFVDKLQNGSEEDVAHEFLQNLKDVKPRYINGIKKRQWACWNMFRDRIAPKDAIRYIDKGLVSKPNLVNEEYSQENERYNNLKNREWNNQAIDSQTSNNDVSRLTQDQQLNEQKQPKEKSFLQRLGEIGMAAINPMYGMVKAAAENQVAQEYENILKENEGEEQ